SGSWRALANNTPNQPGTAFSYISRAFRQTTGSMIGALRLLANSYSPEELNEKGFELYAEFRPRVEGWGGRGEVRCDKVLALRKKHKTSVGNVKEDAVATEPQDCQHNLKIFVKVERANSLQELHNSEDDEPDRKKARGLSLEDYEAALDQDTSFDDVEF
ncbi:hypothetical protein HWV62_5383, partial [Athelia sp. TMB]